MGQGQSSDVTNEQVKQSITELKNTNDTNNDDIKNKILNILTNTTSKCPEGYTFNDKFTFRIQKGDVSQGFTKPNVCTIFPTTIYSMSVLTDDVDYPMPEKLSCPPNSTLIIDDTNATFTNGFKENSTPYCILNQSDNMLKKCQYGISVDAETGISTCKTFEDVSLKNNTNCKNKVFDKELKQEVCSDIIQEKKSIENKLNCPNQVYDRVAKMYKCLDGPQSQTVDRNGNVVNNTMVNPNDATNIVVRNTAGGTNNTTRQSSSDGMNITTRQPLSDGMNITTRQSSTTMPSSDGMIINTVQSSSMPL